MLDFFPDHNLIIKTQLPKVGVVVSYPERANRLCTNFLTGTKVHSQQWGSIVKVGNFNNHPIFVANAPIGAAGAGLLFWEMFVAGAEYIIRFGSNDRYVDESALRDVTIVKCADNLYGLVRDSGGSEHDIGDTFPASPHIIRALEKQCDISGYHPKHAVCHNIEDYHAYNFPELLPTQNRERISDIIYEIEDDQSQMHTWDMETAALFWRAKQFNKHAGTVLQSIVKPVGEDQVYEGKLGRIALEMELVFGEIILNALSEFYT